MEWAIAVYLLVAVDIFTCGEKASKKDKLMWLLVVILVPFIGFLFYLFLGRKELKKLSLANSKPIDNSGVNTALTPPLTTASNNAMMGKNKSGTESIGTEEPSQVILGKSYSELSAVANEPLSLAQKVSKVTGFAIITIAILGGLFIVFIIVALIMLFNSPPSQSTSGSKGAM